MSFILDALKKSENERQRDIGPSFADVKSAVPAMRIPKLWIGIGALLLVNIIALVVLLTRRDQTPVVEAPVVTSRAIAPSTPRPQAVLPTIPATVAAPLPAAAAPAAAAVIDAESGEVSAPEPRLDRPLPAGFTDEGPMPTMNEVLAQGRATLPELHLDMHVYGADSSQRFVSINARKLREGMQVEEGLRVERITRDGVVLNYRGLRFLLPRP